MTPEGDDKVREFRIGRLEIVQEKHEVRLGVLERWQSSVETTIRDKLESTKTTGGQAKDWDWWVKIIIMILTGLLALITFITQKGG